MDTVIKKILRLSERENLLNFLDQLDEIVYNLKIDVKIFIKDKAPFHIQEELSQYFGDELEAEQREELSQKSKQLRQEVRNIPVVKITIAFEPSKEYVLFLSKIFRDEFSKLVLFDFLQDNNLLAGAVIEGNDRIGRYELSRYFSDKGEELLNKNQVGMGRLSDI